MYLIKTSFGTIYSCLNIEYSLQYSLHSANIVANIACVCVMEMGVRNMEMEEESLGKGFAFVLV